MTPPAIPTSCKTPNIADCLAHGKACGRPSVEAFNPVEQARFEAFCGALLRTLTSPDIGRLGDGTFGRPQSYGS